MAPRPLFLPPCKGNTQHTAAEAAFNLIQLRQPRLLAVLDKNQLLCLLLSLLCIIFSSHDQVEASESLDYSRTRE